MKKYEGCTRVWIWFMALLLGALAGGCGGGGGGQEPVPSAVGIAALAPTVTAVTPRPNVTEVPINTKIITAIFSKAMDPTTLTPDSFRLACPVGTTQAGTVGYAANGNVATLTLTNILPTQTLCTASITTSAKDTVGVAMATNFIWTFSSDGAALDTTAPTVTATIHANGQTNVAINTKVGVTFSEAMDPLTITNANFTMRESISGAVVAGTVSYSGVNALFVPAGNLKSYTKYTVTVKGSPSGVKDVRGNMMASDFIISWTTGAAPDTTAPWVSGMQNANGATNVAVNTAVGATFSEAMNPLTITNLNFTVRETVSGAAVAGIVSYAGVTAIFTPLSNLASNMKYTVKVKGGVGGVADLVGNPATGDYIWSWTTAAAADTTAPTVVLLNPADLAPEVLVNRAFHATFSKAMDPLTINTASFRVAGITGTVTYDAASRIATFTPSGDLAASTTYTLTITTGARDTAGNSLAANKVWSITTAAISVVPPMVDLGSASTFGIFSGTLGMTNTGTLTTINGDIGSPATVTLSVTGFHDTVGYIYTVTPANSGAVNGTIYTCVDLTTLPVIAGPTADPCPIAIQAGLDAQAAYLAMAAMPPGADPGANLANLTLAPGVYTSSSGSFQITGGNLTLDAGGDPNAVWVFQMAQSLTVGGPGAAAPQSIVLTGGAQAKNVFWQVGSFATINAAGGGTMVGTIIAHAGAAFSSAGNAAIVTLQGRVLSLGASVTLVDTVINVPSP
jgi:hypothetical protein